MTRIRLFQPQDAPILAQLLHDSVHAVGAQDYSHAQLAAWSPRPIDANSFAQRVGDGRDVFVALSDENAAIGFIELEASGHIDCFYCRPDRVGTGVGAALYQHLEGVATTRQKVRLFVEASEAAHRFFTAQGFGTVRRQEFERNGVRIHNYVMEKTL